MRNLEKYLTKPNIPDIIDPDVSSLTPSPSIPSSTPISVPAITQTSLSTLVSDVISSATQTRLVIQSVISDIVNTTPNDPTFQQYATSVASNSFDATQLLTNPNATPTVVPPLLIKTLERYAYRSVSDPRAPFLQDLWRMDYEASLSSYAMQRVWIKGTQNNSLFNSSDDSRLTRFALYKNNQYLTALKGQAQNIGKLTAPVLTSDFSMGLVNQIASQASPSGTNGMISPQSTSTQLDQVSHLLQRQQISLNENWEKFSDALSAVYPSPVQSAGARIVREQNHVLYAGLAPSVLPFINGIDKGKTGLGSPELLEFRSQTESGLLGILRKVEDDLLVMEAIAITTEEARAMLWQNAKKNSYNKVFTNSVNTAGAGVSSINTVPADGPWKDDLFESLVA